MRPPAVARVGVSSRRALRLHRRALWIGPALLLVLGVLLRLLLLRTPESLEMDEQMLAVSIATRPAWALLGPLELQQVAPPLFLLLQRAAVALVGVRDTAFRLLPFAAAVATPFVVLLVVRALRLPAEARLLAVALGCVTPEPLLYAAITKPYATDALVAAVLVLLAVRVLDAPEERARWTWLIVGGVAAAALSIPAPFVLAGAGAALVASPRVRGQPRVWRRLAVAAALWVATFGAIYLAMYRPASHNIGMRRFWAGRFLADAFSRGAGASELAGGAAEPLFRLDDGVPLTYVLVLAPLLTLAGWAWLARRRGLAAALLLLVPCVLAVMASLLRQYPFGGRVMQFAAPLACVAIGAGVWAVCAMARGWTRRAAFVLLSAALLLPALRYSLFRLRHAEQWEGAAPLARDFLARAPAGSAVYVYARGVPAWLLYTTDWEAPDGARVARLLAAMERLGFNSGNVPSRRRPVAPEEGAGLAFPFRGGTELIGVPAGTGPDDAGRSSPVPDSGWAEHETRRLRAAAHPDVWLFLTHVTPAVAGPLLDAVRAAGGRETYSRTLHGSALYRYAFPGDERARSPEADVRSREIVSIR